MSASAIAESGHDHFSEIWPNFYPDLADASVAAVH